jgi:hypothetical protein
MNEKEYKIYRKIVDDISNSVSILYNINNIPINVLSKLEQTYVLKTIDYQVAESIFVQLLSIKSNDN